jgi:hypothetical protein
MAIATDALLVPQGLGKCLAKGDADILDCVVGIDVQISLGLYLQIDQAMPAT